MSGIWPSTIPAPLAQGGLTRSETTSSLTFDAQNRRVWRRAGSETQLFPARFLLLPAEWDAFCQFVRFDLDQAAGWFSADWITTLVGAAGYMARFTSMPSTTREGGLYVVEAHVEIALLALAQLPIGSGWAISNTVAAPAYPADFMAYQWNAVSEPTADGVLVTSIASLHDAGYTSIAVGGSGNYMESFNSKRSLRTITQTACGYSPSSNYALLYAQTSTWTIALTVGMGSSTQRFRVAFSSIVLAIYAGTIEISGYGGSLQTLSHTLRPSGRVCVVVTAPMEGTINLYVNGSLLWTGTSALGASGSIQFGSNTFSSPYNYLHEIAIYRRILTSDEVITVSDLHMLNWAI